MDSLAIAQVAVKVARYLPFGVYAILVILSRIVISPRHVRAATVMGVAGGIAMVGWLLRYFLEESAPQAAYAVVPSVAAVWSVALPELAHDFAGALAMIVAFGAVATTLPEKK